MLCVLTAGWSSNDNVIAFFSYKIMNNNNFRATMHYAAHKVESILVRSDENTVVLKTKRVRFCDCDLLFF